MMAYGSRPVVASTSEGCFKRKDCSDNDELKFEGKLQAKKQNYSTTTVKASSSLKCYNIKKWN